MKKYLWIVALLTALTLAFIGCPDGGTTTTPVDPGGKQPVISLNPFNVNMADNFQWGEGYQGLIDNLSLFPGGKITEGDVYTMKITFTTSRDLEDVLTVGLVDRTPPPDGDYWIPLSYDADDDGWDIEDEDAMAVVATVDEAANEAVVTKVITFTALHTAKTSLANANSIAFETIGDGDGFKDGNEGTPGSGVKKPFQIRVTEFLFVKGTAEDLESGEIEPPEPEGEKLPITFGEDDTEIVGADTGVEVDYVEGGYEVDYNGKSYSNAYAYFAVDFGEKELADYETVSFTYTGVSGDTDYKNMVLLASATAFSGDLGNDTAVNVITYSIGAQGVRTGGTDVVLNINRLKASIDLEGESELFIALYIGAGAGSAPGTVFTITDVVFTEALDEIPDPITPLSADFGWLYNAPSRNQTVGSTTEITLEAGHIQPNPGKTHGVLSNLKFGESSTFPTTAGTYAITFDVAAAPGWTAATGLSLGNLVLIAPMSVNIDLDGTAASAPIKGVNVTVAVSEDEDSYTATYTNGYGNAFTFFKVDFGTGNKLSDYTTISFKAAGVMENKKFRLLAKATEFSGWLGGDPTGDGADDIQANAGTRVSAASANITLTADDDPAEVELTISGASSFTGQELYLCIYTHVASGAVYTISDISFGKGAIVAQPVTLTDIPGVVAPETSATPILTVTSGQYTGTVAWDDAGTALVGAFAANTAYTATITLTAATGYTFAGVEANAFKVAGVDATSAAGTDENMVITVTFPVTGALITSLDIVGAESVTIEVLNQQASGFTVIGVENGIQVSGGNWQSTYVRIPIKLTGGKTAGDITTVTLNLTGVVKDATNYKNYYLWAGETITGSLDENGAGAATAAAATGNVANGTPVPMTFTITALDEDLEELDEFVIVIWSNMSAVTYEMTNIKINFADD